MTHEFQHLFERDINRLYNEIAAYPDEAHLWLKSEGIANPAGNLCLHLIGNLNEYIGRILGGNPYTRNRPYEFSATGVPKNDLLKQIEQTKTVIVQTLGNLAPQRLSEIYPEEVLGYEMTVSYFLIHLEGHLNYHLGQINYHRRILEV